MLTEHFIASIATPAKAPNASVTKDAGVFLHQLRPLAGQRSFFKKSATKEQCLAVSESHIFAAQAEKAVVNVYNREKGNQEATIPFNEPITCIALARDGSLLILGTESGRILLWEVCTGRLTSTPQSHLQQVTSLAVDPSSHSLLSGSADSNIHVWSIDALLSFTKSDSSAQQDPRTPIHTLPNHRSAINTLACGHGYGQANIAISTSSDQTAVIWNYRKGTALRTYLLGHVPRALVLDSLDRGFYVSYDDGSVQLVDLYASTGSMNSMYDESHSQTATQPGKEHLWTVEGQDLGAGLSLGLNFDGSQLLSGHKNGKIVSWDTAKGRFGSVLNTLPGPVTNLAMLSPKGFPNQEARPFRVHTVMKPRISTEDSSSANGSTIPGNYTFIAQLTGQLPSIQYSATELHLNASKTPKSEFETALTHSCFPDSMLDEGLAELMAWREAPVGSSNNVPTNVKEQEPEADFMSLSTSSGKKSKAKPVKLTAEQENELLKKKIAALQRTQEISFKQLAGQRKEIKILTEEQRTRDRQEAGRMQTGRDEKMEDAEGSSSESEGEEEDESGSENASTPSDNEDDSDEEREDEGSDVSSDRG
ncbi:WD domain-containing protein [Venturia nashicola]|uniref:Pre-rRNA-processing protein IPI3 n=1 Tax=Venturia nashicola TaxID=86259 RepID=A0A4Z1P7E3_9PEZI|nr:WD domain-containing protein [Venturia nashicola]TLD25910.1 WD domain-containing protein [Venturia nashicola]